MPSTDRFKLTVQHTATESIFKVTDRTGYLIQTFRGPVQRSGVRWNEKEQRWKHWEERSETKEKALYLMGYTDSETDEPTGDWYQYYQHGHPSLDPDRDRVKRTKATQTAPQAIPTEPPATCRLSAGARAAIRATVERINPSPKPAKKMHRGATNITNRQGLC